MKIIIKKPLFSSSVLVSMLMPLAVQAAGGTTLQVGAPASVGDSGIYADYSLPGVTTTGPTEEETAFTSGNTILFAGATGHFNNQGAYVADLLQLGGQYGAGADYSSLSNGAITVKDASGKYIFDDRGAIALMTVANGLGGQAFNAITLAGISAFYWDATNSFFPNNHDPLGTAANDKADYVFFDIGNFIGQTQIYNFVDETPLGKSAGQVKSLDLAGVPSNFEWLHFDVIAIATGRQGQSSIVSNLYNNPGSHDVTWKNGGSNPQGCTFPGAPGCAVPEPSELALLCIGVFGMTVARKVRRRVSA